MAKRTRGKAGSSAATDAAHKGQTEITKTILLDALAKVKPAIANKEVVEQSTYFIFDDTRIWTYNDQLAISHEIKTGITGAVREAEFYAMVKKIEGETIWLEQQQGQILLETESDSVSVNIDPDIKAQGITVPGINSKQWRSLPDNFTDAVFACLFSTAKSLDRPALNCIWVEGDCVLSTDRYRASQHALNTPVKQPFMLPYVAARELRQYNAYKVYLDKQWIHFVNREHTFFSCRTIEGEYPVAEATAIFDCEGERLQLPDNLADAIDFVQSLLVEDFDVNKVVTLTIEPGLITCNSNSVIGKANRKIKGENGYTGKPIKIEVNPTFLNEIVGKIDTVVIADRLLFEGEGFKHALCLIEQG